PATDGFKGDAGSVFRDLADAQSEFAPVVFNRVNPAFHNRYADLAAILAAVRPSLNRHGLFLSQRVTSTGGSVEVETVIMHKSGETISSGILSIPVDVRGGNRAQAFGSARTYACRYSLSSFLGVAADDDDDGNACAPAPAPAKPRPAPKAAKPTHAPAPAPAPKPEAPKPSDELIKDSRAAAMNGMATYKSYFSKLRKEEQKALVASGIHAENKETAEQADAAVNNEEAPV
ncbi:MAG: ERF family protein, partial [Mesosutterella sp.]|nr:ERF family protein [Mesosutterella sp.]